jgi:hypothetical protein
MQPGSYIYYAARHNRKTVFTSFCKPILQPIGQGKEEGTLIKSKFLYSLVRFTWARKRLDTQTSSLL